MVAVSSSISFCLKLQIFTGQHTNLIILSFFHMKCLKAVKIRVSIIGLSAEVRVCTVLARETGGMYLNFYSYKKSLKSKLSN